MPSRSVSSCKPRCGCHLITQRRGDRDRRGCSPSATRSPGRLPHCPFQIELFTTLCTIIEPALERYAITDSFACRVGKGQHAALGRAREFARGTVGGWFLKGDVSAYFASISHDRLLALVERRVKDATMVGFLERIIRAYPVTPGRGLPIGALTSQHLANLYLGALDHHVKDDRGVRRYLRYMDDFVAFGEEASMKSLRDSVETFLRERLDLRLNIGISRGTTHPRRCAIPWDASLPAIDSDRAPRDGDAFGIVTQR